MPDGLNAFPCYGKDCLGDTGKQIPSRLPGLHLFFPLSPMSTACRYPHSKSYRNRADNYGSSCLLIQEI